MVEFLIWYIVSGFVFVIAIFLIVYLFRYIDGNSPGRDL